MTMTKAEWIKMHLDMLRSASQAMQICVTDEANAYTSGAK